MAIYQSKHFNLLENLLSNAYCKIRGISFIFQATNYDEQTNLIKNELRYNKSIEYMCVRISDVDIDYNKLFLAIKNHPHLNNLHIICTRLHNSIKNFTIHKPYKPLNLTLAGLYGNYADIKYIIEYGNLGYSKH